MHNITKVAVTALALAAMGMTAARAGSSANTVVTNDSSDSVWVTYYNVTKNQLGTDCIRSHVVKTDYWDYKSVINSEGGIYFRFEYKQNTNCGGKTLYDSHYGGLYQMPTLGHTLSVTIPSR